MPAQFVSGPSVPTPMDTPDEFVHAFGASMPDAYRAHYDEAEMQNHAQIAWRRGDRVAQVELCPSGKPDVTWLCVVTDDRPGLLSLLSSAISAYSLDILSARIYCRKRPDLCNEAVDLFLVRPLNSLDVDSTLDESHLAAIRESIVSLLLGETDIDSLEKRSHPTVRPTSSPPPQVFFDEEAREADLLIVDADDRLGLLSSITSALFREGVAILLSDVLTIAGRARDKFRVVELDGSRLSPSRKEVIVDRVAAAVGRTR